MNPTSSSSLTRSQLLQVDRLADQLEASFFNDSQFDAEAFLEAVDDSQVASALRQELRRMQQGQPTLVSASTTGEAQPSGRACEVSCFEPGMVIDDFELTELVGRGATSVVWKARNLRLGRDVALKFPTVYSNSIANRLERESHAVARLSHPNIATIYENRNHGSGAYLVTEFIQGVPLQRHIESNSLSLDASVAMLIQIAEAIAYSHSMQVIHRDLKPQNILIREDDVPVVVDFGLARVLADELAVLTQEGDFVGTPGYMSPEQAAGRQDLDSRIDVYSLGVLMFQMMTGQLPFQGNVQSVVHQILNEPPPTPSAINSQVDRDLDTICLRCLSKEPDQRFSSATELALELRRYQNGESIHSRPASSFEKVIRWSKSKPFEAALVGWLMLSLLILTGGAMVYAYSMQKMRDQEYTLRKNAEQSEFAATRLRQKVEQALEESNQQKALARAEAFENQETVKFLRSVFQDSDVVRWILKGYGVREGKPPTLEQIFSNAAVGLNEEFAGSERTKANLLETLGDSCRASGFLPLARDLLTQAKTIRNQLPADPQDPFRLDLIANRMLFAKLDHDEGNYAQAQDGYEQCCSDLKQLTPTGYADEADRRWEIEAESRFHLGRLLLTQQRNAEAREHFQIVVDGSSNRQRGNTFVARASEVGLEFCDKESWEVPATGPVAEYFQKDEWAQKVVSEFATLMTYRATGDWSKASRKYAALLQVLQERLPENNRWYLLALGDCAGVQFRAGDYELAYQNVSQAIKNGEAISPGHPHLLKAKLTLGKELIRAKRIQEGCRYLESVDQYLRDQGRESEVSPDLLAELANGWIQLGRFEDATAVLLRLRQDDKLWPTVMKAWVCHLESLAWESGDSARAEQALRRARHYAESLDDPPANGIWCSRLATIYSHQENWATAETMARAAVFYDSRRFFPDHPRVANRQMELGAILMVRGKLVEARNAFEIALKSRAKFLFRDNPLVTEARESLSSVGDEASH